MNRTMKLIAGGVLAAAIVVSGAAGIAVATGAVGDDNEAPITGEALERASAAALAHIRQVEPSAGGGRVTETEVGDEESMYEVEVTLDDGSQVDVQLDENFKVVGDEADASGDDENEDGDAR